MSSSATVCARRVVAACVVACALVLQRGVAAPPLQPATDEAFMVDAKAAMSKMMSAMSVRPSGEVDRDFASTMIPHHQGAIDMAVAELHYGTNERLRRLAQEIIVEQQQEIAVMRLALVETPISPSASNGTP